MGDDKSVCVGDCPTHTLAENCLMEGGPLYSLSPLSILPLVLFCNLPLTFFFLPKVNSYGYVHIIVFSVGVFAELKTEVQSKGQSALGSSH